MKRIVLIDGENLVYGIRHLLGKNEEKAPRSSVNNFDFRGLIEELLSDNVPQEILWFGARLRKYSNTDEIEKKSEKAILDQSRFMNHIQSQKIHFIKAGYLRARELEPCEVCAHQAWKLTEKGVDVGLAVRMLTEAQEGTELVIISADTDLLPAFKATTKLGAKVMHVGYEFRPVHALFKSSDSVRTITIPMVQKYQKQNK